jgi:Ribonuclease G/E
VKGRSILLGTLDGREAAALMVDGRLEDFLIDAVAPRPGTIYRAIADRPVKGQGGMFLKTPDGPAFLRQVKGLAPGQMLLVQVSGHAEPGKALPVTQKLLFKSRHAIATPDAPGINVSRSIRDEAERDRLLEIAHEALTGHETGLILRSCCAEAGDEEIAADVEAMAALAHAVTTDAGDAMETLLEGDGPHALAWCEWTEPAAVHEGESVFADHGVLDALDAVRSAEVPLDGGGSLIVEPTRALIAVDVNTGHDFSPGAALKANLACAKALPRALRLRGLGGQIVVDPAPMPKKDRRAFETALRQAFRADPIETALAGWTPLGHFELQRKRARCPLHEVLG